MPYRCHSDHRGQTSQERLLVTARPQLDGFEFLVDTRDWILSIVFLKVSGNVREGDKRWVVT